MISSKEDIKASVASFAASCCSTLRGQDSSAGCVSVFACSNGTGRENLPPGILFKKSGVILSDIVPGPGKTPNTEVFVGPMFQLETARARREIIVGKIARPMRQRYSIP